LALFEFVSDFGFPAPPACLSLGAGRPAGLSPPGAPGPYTYEPCDDVDPTPDYENVLTD
jgi:hypothetical protein